MQPQEDEHSPPLLHSLTSVEKQHSVHRFHGLPNERRSWSSYSRQNAERPDGFCVVTAANAAEAVHSDVACAGPSADLCTPTCFDFQEVLLECWSGPRRLRPARDEYESLLLQPRPPWLFSSSNGPC